MDYGRFSDDGREFIITRPDTPRPWINCLTNGSYTALVSQTGGGYSFIGGPGYDRVTRACPDIAASDRPGRYIYVRDDASGEYFSVGWQPTRRPPDWYECRHSPGMTTISSTNLGITGRITYFVPLDDNLEIWRVRIENSREEQVELSVFTYVEWVLGNWADDLEDRPFWSLFNEVSFEDNYVVATKSAWRRPDLASVTLRDMRPAGGPEFLPETIRSNQAWGKHAFIALSIPVDGFDCDREAFIGRYQDLGRPSVVERGRCTGSEGSGRDAIGVLQARLVIPARGSAAFDVLLGVTLHRNDPSGVVARYSDPEEVNAKLDAVTRCWSAYLAKFTVSTPDPDLDRAANVWDKYQAWVSARTFGLASLYRGGSTVQFAERADSLLGCLPMDPESARSLTGHLVRRQYRDGSTVHHWELRSDVGTRTGHLHDPICLVFAVITYLKETADFGFLDEQIPYYFGQRRAAVYDHMVQALDFCLSQLSPGGLALLGPGDWNVALDQAGREGKGESVLTSQMLCRALLEAAEVAAQRGDRARASAWSTAASSIGARINELAWNGRWYIRAVADSGEPIGGSESSDRIYLNPQSWAVISGTAPPDRAAQAMDSAGERLGTPYGPALVLPAYEKPDKRIGALTRLRPGALQNGGISVQAACWAIMAECMLGRGARAYEIFRKCLCAGAWSDHGSFATEPYARPEFIFGPASDRLGEGMRPWAAVASWAWRASTDWICGVRPDYSGLRVDPCIPPDWREFSLVRPFRDAVYRITVRNPDGVEKGVRELVVDGTKVRPDRTMTDFRDGKVHDVRAAMGALTS